MFASDEMLCNLYYAACSLLFHEITWRSIGGSFRYFLHDFRGLERLNLLVSADMLPCPQQWQVQDEEVTQERIVIVECWGMSFPVDSPSVRLRHDDLPTLGCVLLLLLHWDPLCLYWFQPVRPPEDPIAVNVMQSPHIQMLEGISTLNSDWRNWEW